MAKLFEGTAEEADGGSVEASGLRAALEDFGVEEAEIDASMNHVSGPRVSLGEWKAGLRSNSLEAIGAELEGIVDVEPIEPAAADPLAGAEAVELIMWLTMRGALDGNPVRQVHRNYYAPMTTGMGLIALEQSI